MDASQSEWLCREIGYVLSEAAKEFNDQQGTLRDRFAMAALQGLLAFPRNSHTDSKAVALHAYVLADAMLAARESNPEAAVGVP